MEKKIQKKEKTEVKKTVLASVAVRVASIITVAVVAVVLFLVVSTHIHNTYFTEKREIKDGMVSRQLLACSELVSEKYRYSDIVTLKKSILFSKSYSIVKFTGLIRAGIRDVSEIKYEIQKGGKTIFLTVPACEILGNEIVEQSVFDEKRSVFVPITIQEIFSEIDSVRNELAEEICGEGFLDEANASAKRIIVEMMYALGFEEVIIN